MNTRPSTRAMLACMAIMAATAATAQDYNVRQMGDTIMAELAPQTVSVRTSGDTTIVEIANPQKFLILPVQDSCPEAQVKLDTGSPSDTWMDIRLARTQTDYGVPFALGDGDTATVKMLNIRPTDLALTSLSTTDVWTTEPSGAYRPLYHHTPPYGWMGDACATVANGGAYHLFYQHNPYGTTWGNTHWGHAVSEDLAHWAEQPIALARDNSGRISSGCAIVDTDNTAGFGAGAVIAFYTSDDGKGNQAQCMAYSNDNGLTFTKFEDNPVLRPTGVTKQFRDPKVFRHEPTGAWYMIVAAGSELRFYKSKNLRKWSYVSSFGSAMGEQPRQYECPDIMCLPADGNRDSMKYVLTANVSTGGHFGGSATEYFVGHFDGKEFTCADNPHTPKRLDYGNDHRTAITFANTADRAIAMPWMGNWQYAEATPTRMFRGTNALPRELSLYTNNGRHYVAANAVPEVRKLRRGRNRIDDATVEGTVELKRVARRTEGAFEFEADITPDNAAEVGIELYNDKGERTVISLDMKQMRAAMDRAESGLTDFGRRPRPRATEAPADGKADGVGNQTQGPDNAANARNDFATPTWAPLTLCNGKTYHVDIFVDKCSVELFIDGGRIAMTNLVFPTKPYDSIRLRAKGGKADFTRMTVYGMRM